MGVVKPAAASLTQAPVFPHIKVMAIAYANWYTPDQLAFMGTHYDAFIGNAEAVGEAPSFTYTNYYCMYVGKEEYLDAQAWAQAHGVDFESFFLHYSEATACHPYAKETYTLPAGSRVPTYQWYGTGGDMTKTGARVVMNVGNPNYRAWKLDYVDRQLQKTGADGVFVDNTSFTFMPGNFTITSGGAITEYPSDFLASYATDLLKVFEGFHTKFGDSKGQLANIGLGDDSRVYPYLWGIFREGMDQPGGLPSYPMIDKALTDSTAAGVKANLIGSYWPEARWDMAGLAFFYMVSNETCYFMPFLQYVSDEFASDPKGNQWYGAVAYDIGKPTAARRVLMSGIDPSSTAKDTLSATVTKSTTYIYRLTDTTKTWSDKQWNNASVIFPSGFAMKAYKSGPNWIELYNPGEVPTDGVYQVGTSTYTVLARDYGKALVLFRPKVQANANTGEASAVTVQLPVTADNPSGRYFLLTRDGTLEPTLLTSLSLRNTDGAILVKESSDQSPDVPVRADFSAAPARGEAPRAVQFADLSTGFPTSWAWDFGDGDTSTAQNPSHTYGTGRYTVALTAANASGSNTCTKSDYVTVAPPAPEADFAGAPTSGTAPLEVSFTDASTDSPTSWSWDFGDGSTSTAQNPGHTYTAAGRYAVSLTAANEGGSNTCTKSDYVTVTPPAPVASFTTSVTSGTVPLNVSFTDASTNDPTSWFWDFGDGGASTEQNPSHTYTTGGSFPVALTVANAGGADTSTQAGYLKAASFPDVLPDQWAWMEVEACVAHGLAAGYPDGNYAPTLIVNRGQMAVFVARARAGGDSQIPTPPATAHFPDVPTDYWAFKQIEYVCAQGIVNGYPDGRYEPDLDLDRGQLAVFIARATTTPTGEASLSSYTPPTTPSFPDVPTDFWSFTHVEYLKARAVVGGYPDGAYHPEFAVTRDQMAVLLARAFALIP